MSDNVDRFDTATKHLGHNGRMLSGSKSAYANANPKHRVCFNGNVFAGDTAQKLWYGDIDLDRPGTLDSLRALAGELGCHVYVTSEMPFRFEPPKSPADLERALSAEYPRAYRIDP